MLCEGDTLTVWKLNRLWRSVKKLVDRVGELHKRDIQFKSLTDAIDTGTPSDQEPRRFSSNAVSLDSCDHQVARLGRQ